jgi:hypothetical protein
MLFGLYNPPKKMSLSQFSGEEIEGRSLSDFAHDTQQVAEAEVEFGSV